MSKPSGFFQRPQASTLAKRLGEPRRFVQALADPRQVGKSTLVQQVSRGSSPKLQVLNTALMSAASGLTLAEAHVDREFWGHLVESAVGAHLANAAAGDCELYYWRERNHEVDFVVKAGRRLTAIEVKSGRAPLAHAGAAAFAQAFKVHRALLVGGDGVPVEDFLLRPVTHWIGL